MHQIRRYVANALATHPRKKDCLQKSEMTLEHTYREMNRTMENHSKESINSIFSASKTSQ